MSPFVLRAEAPWFQPRKLRPRRLIPSPLRLGRKSIGPGRARLYFCSLFCRIDRRVHLFANIARIWFKVRPEIRLCACCTSLLFNRFFLLTWYLEVILDVQNRDKNATESSANFHPVPSGEHLPAPSHNVFRQRSPTFSHVWAPRKPICISGPPCSQNSCF